MAWDIGDYNEFLGEAQDVFGLERDEAQVLYQEMREAFGQSLTVDDLRDYGDVASDLVEDMFLPEPEAVEAVEEIDYGDLVEEVEAGDWDDVPREQLPDLGRDDEYGWDDEWLDPGDEIEVTADLAYEEGATT